MNKIAGFLPIAFVLASLPAWAEPLPAPATPTPAQSKPGAAAAPAASAPLIPPVPTVSSGQLLEQRRQQELVANAEKIDQANRDLLAQNQQLQLQNENLNIQVKVLQGDRSSEGVRNGALAVLAGLMVGWFFFGTGKRNKGSW